MNEQALKARLKHIGKEKGKSFNEVWKLLVLERFLARLSRSEYSDKFIFKGGLLLSYYLAIGRETIDIDLLARRLNAEKSNVELIMQEICLLNLDDGFQMQFINLDDLDHQHMNYPGFQIGIAVQFGVMSDKFFVDIGVGDVVDPVLLEWPSFNYKEKPLFEDLISLEVYPVETIFSEKLETLISRGAANSRMKDYHDLLLLCRESKLIDKIRLKDNIIQTFQNRGTVFSLPVQFQPDELERMQLLWSGHLRVLGAHRVQVLGLPEKIDTVINDINRWLLTTWSDSIDFQISRSVLGSIESEPIDVTVVLMQAYQNKSGKSGIVAYEIGNDFIKVKFKDSEPYLYNYKTPGADHVEEMKKRAIDGIGLNTYINKQVKNNYYNKVM